MAKIGFGLVDVFQTAFERYGMWPTTVWDLNDQDPIVKKMREEIGDFGQSRFDDPSLAPKSKSGHLFFYRPASKKIISTFNPVIVIKILNLYGKGVQNVYDPFAGGGCRAIVCGKKGLNYKGVELRKKEVEFILKRCKELNISSVTIIHGDSRNVPQVESNWADLIITCPPYWNFEMYYGGEKDLSMAPTYEIFLSGIKDCIKECYRILKPGGRSFWVVGLFVKEKNLIAMNHDISYLHKEVGFHLKEEIVLNKISKVWAGTGRVGTFEKGENFLIRTHEYLLRFDKPKIERRIKHEN